MDTNSNLITSLSEKYHLNRRDVEQIFNSLSVAENKGNNEIIFNKGEEYDELPQTVRRYFSSLNESILRRDETSQSAIDQFNATKDKIYVDGSEDAMMDVFWKTREMANQTNASRLEKLTLFSESVIDRFDHFGIEDDVTKSQMLNVMCILKKIDTLCEYECKVAEVKNHLVSRFKADSKNYEGRYDFFPYKTLEEYSRMLTFLVRMTNKQKDQEIDKMLEFIGKFPSPYLDPKRSVNFYPGKDYTLKMVSEKLEGQSSENKEKVGLGNNLDTVFASGSEKGKVQSLQKNSQQG